MPQSDELNQRHVSNYDSDISALNNSERCDPPPDLGPAAGLAGERRYTDEVDDARRRLTRDLSEVISDSIPALLILEIYFQMS